MHLLHHPHVPHNRILEGVASDTRTHLWAEYLCLEQTTASGEIEARGLGDDPRAWHCGLADDAIRAALYPDHLVRLGAG